MYGALTIGCVWYCLVLPLSFSHLFFACEYYTRKIEGEGEPDTEPRPPMATLASHSHDHGSHTLRCAQYRSRAALWIMTNFTKRSLQSRPVKFILFFTETQGHRSRWQKLSWYKLKAFTAYYLSDVTNWNYDQQGAVLCTMERVAAMIMAMTGQAGRGSIPGSPSPSIFRV